MGDLMQGQFYLRAMRHERSGLQNQSERLQAVSNADRAPDEIHLPDPFLNVV